MTNGVLHVLRLVSDEYNIDYDDLLKLVAKEKNKTLSKSKKKKQKNKVLEHLSYDNKSYIYDEETNTLYNEDMLEVGFLCEETGDPIITHVF